MRYLPVGSNPVEAKLLDSNPSVRSLFDPFLPVIQARTLIAAVRLCIFDAIRGDRITAAELSRSLSLNEDILELMMRVLVCAGYLSVDGELYSLTELSLASLTRESPVKLTAWVNFNSIQLEALRNLEDVVKTGESIDLNQFLTEREMWGVNQEAMLETARPAAEWVASMVPVRRGAAKMLDIGGGHGLYGAALCGKHPPMRSVVLELPDALPFARELGNREGFGDLVDYRSGDILSEDLGVESYDSVILGNIVHHFTEAQNKSILEKARSALRDAGSVAIWDFNRPGEDSPPDLVTDGFALFFGITSSTRCYSSSEYRDWLTSSGYIDVKVHTAPSPSHVLVTGIAPGQC